MCGIAGIIAADPSLVTSERLEKMNQSLAHRGPDGEKTWISLTGQAGFAHRRLSIIDLSEKAAQPMHYLNRYTILHNGEIYNYRELRTALQQKGYTFQTHSDTEIITAAYDCYKNACLQHFDGMFAFVIWDGQEQQLFAARDRFGEKPFYYFHDQRQFVFASEMKGLWAAGIDKQLNEKMLFNYLTIGYTQNPALPGETFYTGIQKLPARSFITFRPGQPAVTPQTYWNIETDQADQTITGSKAIESFRQLFDRSIYRRLRSDVPLGTSLSGGIDSSSVLAGISSGRPAIIKTFSAVFPGYEKDESGYIRMMTQAFQTSNYQVTPSADTFINDLEKVCYQQEEPFQSASIITQYSVYKLAAEHGVKVLLDGQGADEILGGYHKYYHWYWQELFSNDKELLKKEMAAARTNGIHEPWGWQNKMAATFPLMACMYLVRQKSRRQRRQPGLTNDFVQQYGKSYYDIPHPDSLNDALYFNTFRNGLEELLRYADRNAMANGVEVRLPFLDHELVNYVFSLPAGFKIHNGYTKWLLRKSMEGRLPDAITWRKDKIGFEPPQKQWLQDPAIADYFHESLKTLVAKGILQKDILNKKNQPAEAHAAENSYWRYLLAGFFLR